MFRQNHSEALRCGEGEAQSKRGSNSSTPEDCLLQLSAKRGSRCIQRRHLHPRSNQLGQFSIAACRTSTELLPIYMSANCLFKSSYSCTLVRQRPSFVSCVTECIPIRRRIIGDAGMLEERKQKVGFSPGAGKWLFHCTELIASLYIGATAVAVRGVSCIRWSTMAKCPDLDGPSEALLRSQSRSPTVSTWTEDFQGCPRLLCRGIYL